MQLLYGNDGVNYHTIAKSEEITAEQERELLNSYLGYDFVGNPEIYSSVSEEPVNIIYATTDLANTLNEEKILIGFGGRMANYLTPSYWMHFKFLDIDKSIYGKNFINLLNMDFIRDVDINAYKNRNIDEFKIDNMRESVINSDAVDHDKLVALVAMVLDSVAGISKRVHLVVDAEGDKYNSRSKEIVASIYRRLPFNIRKQAGFSTYGGNLDIKSSRIKLVLHTNNEGGNIENAIRLDSMNPADICRDIPSEIVEMAKAFVNIPLDELDDGWFGSFHTVFVNESASVQEHYSFFKNVRKWQTADLEQIRDELAMYAYQEMGKESRGNTYKLFCNVINSRIESDRYGERYTTIMKELLGVQNNSFDKRTKAYIMLGEAIPVLELPEEAFIEWEHRNIIYALEEKYTEKELIKQYQRAYQFIQGLKVGGTKFEIIRNRMEQVIKDRVSEIKEEIKKNAKREQDELTEYISQTVPWSNAKDIIDYFKKIKYEENISVFESVLKNHIKGTLDSLDYFKSYEEYKNAKNYINDITHEFPEVKEINAVIEIKGRVIRKVEDNRIVSWKNRKDILNTFENIANNNALEEKYEIDKTVYEIKIYGRSIKFDENELKTVIAFILSSEDGNSFAAENIFKNKEGLLDSLISAELLWNENYKQLSRMKLNSDLISKIRRRLQNGDNIITTGRTVESNNDKNTLKTPPAYHFQETPHTVKPTNRIDSSNDEESMRKIIFTVIMIALMIAIIILGVQFLMFHFLVETKALFHIIFVAIGGLMFSVGILTQIVRQKFTSLLLGISAGGLMTVVGAFIIMFLSRG